MRRTRLRLSLGAALGLAMLSGCSSAPDPEGTETTSGQLTIKMCLGSLCNSSCAEQPGVAGGQCVNTACVCDAPTCGQNLQYPCTGGYCASGLHPSAALGGMCGSCGGLDQPCCDPNNDNPAITNCYGGLTCGNALPAPTSYCQACGGSGQPACANASCVNGLSAAVSGNGTTVCVALCGVCGTLPCYDDGINTGGSCQTGLGVLAGSPDCQELCGAPGQSCCPATCNDAYSAPGACNSGSSCEKLEPGFYECWPNASGGGGNAGGGGGCDENCDPCNPDECEPCEECEGDGDGDSRRR